MPGFKRLFRLNDRNLERDVGEELRFHLEMKARDLEARARNPDDAREEALRCFGDPEEIGSQCVAIQSAVTQRRARRRTLESSLQNLHCAVRALRRRPGITVAAVLTLAVGIGATTAMFGVLKAVVLGPLSFRAPDRVVQVWDYPIGTSMPQANLREYAKLTHVFSRSAALFPVSVYTQREDRLLSIASMNVSADLFNMMGVVPTRGRTFLPEEDLAGTSRVVLLTYGYWQREFGGREVIGQTIPLQRWAEGLREGGRFGWERAEYEIIGILPPDFQFPALRRGPFYGVWAGDMADDGRTATPEVVLPLGLIGSPAWRVRVLAELREGVTVERARAELQAVASGIAEHTPQTPSGIDQTGLEVTIVPAGELPRQEYGAAMGFLWAATALVLLVACLSVSSLLLGWGVARERELAVRAALGAGVRRVFVQLLSEATVLAAAAGVLGVLLAIWGMGAIKILTPPGVQRIDEVGLDVGVLAFSLGVSAASVLLIGLWPALRGAGRRSSEALTAGSRGATLASTRSLRALVTAEVALSMALLTGAGLMLQSFWNLAGVDTGIGERVVQVDITVPYGNLSKWEGPAGMIELASLMKPRVEAIPGVTAFAATLAAPLSGYEPGGQYEITIPGRPHPPDHERIGVDWYGKPAEYFHVLGIRLLEGRMFDVADRETAAGQQGARGDQRGHGESVLA